MQKIKLHWVTPVHNQVGNALGYNSHNSSMKKWSEPYFEYTEDAPIALTIIPADHFKPVPNKINVLFTMWEMMDLPETYIKSLNEKADVIIVPCSWNKELFRKYTDKPIYVCHEGIDPAFFKFHERKVPMTTGGAQKFRFLWVGAPNPRKGYAPVLQLVKIIEGTPNCEVYLKTTMPKMTWAKTLTNAWRKRKQIMFDRTEHGKMIRKTFWQILRRIPTPYMADKITYMGKHKNIIWDTRKLPLKELVGLYNSAHCFVLPHFGEGWGLTLCEAMATGCPSIATETTGCKDFFNREVGYPIDFVEREQQLENYNMISKAYCPNVKDFIEKCIYVLTHYPEAVNKGRKASELITRKFTWEQSGKRLHEIINEILTKRGTR